MNAFFTPFKVGLLVISASSALVWMSAQVKEGIDDSPDLTRSWALFKDVSGLAVRSKVVIAGITVGQVDKISLEGDQARVDLKLTVPVRTDARIAKRQASLLGESYLQLTPGYQGVPIPQGGQLKNVDYDTSPSDLMEEVRGIMLNVNEITLSLKNVIAGENGEQRLVSILDNINKVVESMNEAVSGNSPKIDQVVDNVINVTEEAKRFTEDFRRKANLILADAQRVSENARYITQDVREIVSKDGAGGSSVRAAMTKLELSVKRLDDTLEHTRSIAQKIDEGQGSLGQLVNNDQLARSVGNFVDESSRFLSRLTRVQFQVAISSEYYTQGDAVKNFFELRMIPKPDKYYLLQLVDSPARKVKSVDRITTSTLNMGNPMTLRETQVTTEDQFLITLQFAKRFHFLTGRIGLLESSGALGLDGSFLDEDLNIVTDLFNFSDNEYPRFRARATYRFFTHLYIAAGMDDVLNSSQRDYFLGGGIRFNDDDLQAILATAPTPSF